MTPEIIGLGLVRVEGLRSRVSYGFVTVCQASPRALALLRAAKAFNSP